MKPDEHRSSKPRLWGAVVTGVLTGRGLLNGESESFRAVLRRAVVTVGVPTGTQSLSRETENPPGA